MKAQPFITVVGGGIAGMTAAWRLVELGAHVQLISNTVLRRSSSVVLDSGINAVFPGNADCVEQHFEDTIRFGAHLANQNPVYRLCADAPRLVNFLQRLGVIFERTNEGYLKSSQSSGSRQARTYQVAAIGLQTLRALDGQMRRLVREGKIDLREATEFVSLVLDGQGRCCGLIAQNISDLSLEVLRADAVVLCTGDFSALFDKNALMSQRRGAAIAQAYRQGAALANPEFLQIQDHIVTATLGGLWVDDDHMTNLPGVYAAGDCAAQYRGRQRLPGNQILELLHGGFIAAASIRAYTDGRETSGTAVSETFYQDELQRQEFFVQYLRDLNGPENLHALTEEVCSVLANDFLSPRLPRDGGQSAVRIEDWKAQFHRVTLFDKGSWHNHELFAARQFDGMLDLAQAVITAAPLRTEGHVRKKTKVLWSRKGPKVFYEDIEVSRLPHDKIISKESEGDDGTSRSHLAAVRSVS